MSDDPKRDAREKERRVAERAAQILGLPAEEYNRHQAAHKRMLARGHFGRTPKIGDTLGPILARFNVERVETRACMRCGFEGELDEDGKVIPGAIRLRLDPLNGGPPRGFGLVCTFRPDGEGNDLGCYEELEQLLAEHNATVIAEQKRRFAEKREAAEEAKKPKRHSQRPLEFGQAGKEKPF